MINQNLQILLTLNPLQAHVRKFLNFVLHQGANGLSPPIALPPLVKNQPDARATSQ